MRTRARKLLLGLLAGAVVPAVLGAVGGLAAPSAGHAPVFVASSPPACPAGTNWDALRKLCV
ncbi:hypothetical protein AB0H83_49805 [Dactylosporangium sp. NPDC050688]|uniref:hypothetical protein n=1 Tax=Dactylosporangium sp. NPDC050688 TaxID=3157217 RepID=UPI0033C5F755